MANLVKLLTDIDTDVDIRKTDFSSRGVSGSIENMLHYPRYVKKSCGKN